MHAYDTSFSFVQVTNEKYNGSDLVCNSDTVRIEEGECDGTSFKDWPSLIVVFIGIFIIGIGVSFFYALGLPYVDDNTEKVNR